jgi:NTE family protein
MSVSEDSGKLSQENQEKLSQENQEKLSQENPKGKLSQIKHLYLCGGGINVIAHLGVLNVLQEHNLLKNIETWIGISAGALIALSTSIGYSIAEMNNFFMNFEFTELLDPDDSIDGLIGNCGVDTGNRLYNFIVALLHEKGFKETLTFGELGSRNDGSGDLIVFATDLNTGKLLKFSKETTPFYPVAVAVRASMTYPLYFQPQVCPQTGHLLVDGGVISNYPLYLFDKEMHENMLGISFNYTMEQKEELELEDLVFRPISLLMVSRNQREIAQYLDRTVIIEMGNRNPLNFEISLDEKLQLVEVGKSTMEVWLGKFD